MMRPTELMPKKKGNCNVVATWPHHVILLVIISNDISLSLPIAFTYCLIPDGSPFQYTKPHSSIIGNWFSYIALLRSIPAAIPSVGKRTSRYPSVILLQFWFLLTNIPFVGTQPFFFRIYLDLDHLIKSCDWWRPIKQIQPRMALALRGRDSSLKHRCRALENLRDEAQDARHTRRSEERLLGVCSTPLQEKLVPPMLL